MRFLAAAAALSLALLSACATQEHAMTTTRTDVITMRGKPLTLEGTPTKVGDKAPAFTAVANDMTEKHLSDYAGRTVILSTVPSLDTPVCDLETRTFNQKASELPGNAVVLTVSMDLPFAQKRWCGAHDVKNVVTLSDSKLRQVGTSYGVYIRENGLLARAVYVIDAGGVIRYQQIVPDVATEPNYDAVLEAARKAASK